MQHERRCPLSFIIDLKKMRWSLLRAIFVIDHFLLRFLPFSWILHQKKRHLKNHLQLYSGPVHGKNSSKTPSFGSCEWNEHASLESSFPKRRRWRESWLADIYGSDFYSRTSSFCCWSGWLSVLGRCFSGEKSGCFRRFKCISHKTRSSWDSGPTERRPGSRSPPGIEWWTASSRSLCGRSRYLSRTL